MDLLQNTNSLKNTGTMKDLDLYQETLHKRAEELAKLYARVDWTMSSTSILNELITQFIPLAELSVEWSAKDFRHGYRCGFAACASKCENGMVMHPVNLELTKTNLLIEYGLMPEIKNNEG